MMALQRCFVFGYLDPEAENFRSRNDGSVEMPCVLIL